MSALLCFLATALLCVATRHAVAEGEGEGRSPGEVKEEDTSLLALPATRLRVSPQSPPSLGLRGPGARGIGSAATAGGEGGDSPAKDPRCELRGVFNCAGPRAPYPNVPGVMYYSEFAVPQIPEVFDPQGMTYYDYFNIWWTEQPPGGYFSQFVPQLYLGGTLSDSSNAVVEDGTAYNPRYHQLSTWHLGSMYYFAVCDKGAGEEYNCTTETWHSRAATGRLVPVEPGERVWTRFVLGPDWVWSLGMGVVGGGPDRESYVTVEKPFMGLLPGTSSWREERYKSVHIGGCTEDYYMRRGSIPPAWQVDLTVTSLEPGDFWRDWDEICEATCPWAPKGRVASVVSEDRRTQWARWNISMEPHAPGAGADTLTAA